MKESQYRPLQAKCTAPRLGKVLTRPAVHKVLDDGTPILWIHGAPGMGKSTLVADYLTSRKLRPTWLQLDGDDADPATFFQSLTAACLQSDPQLSSALPRCSADALLGLEKFAAHFFQTLMTQLPPPYALVFDNAQALPDDSPLHAILSANLRNLPPSCRVIFISRQIPPGCYVKLRAARAMQTITGETLALSAKEIGKLAKLLSGKAISANSACQLHELTRGWTAGVVLLLDYRRDGAAPHMMPMMQETQGVFDYFASEVFTRLDVITQALLLRICILPAVSEPLLRDLAGDDALDAMLRLYNSNCFVSFHPTPVPTYQLHALYRDFLLAKARADFSTAEWHDINRQIAALAEQHGFLDAAVQSYCEAHHWPDACRVILTHAGALAAQGNMHAVHEWINRLPPALRESDPWLLYWQGMAQLFRNPMAARPWLEKAHARFTATADSLGQTLAAAGVIDALLFAMGPSVLADPWIDPLEHSLRATGHFPNAEVKARVLYSLLSAMMVRCPQHPRICQVAGDLLGVLAHVEDIDLGILGRKNVAYLWIFFGRMNEAFALLEDSLRIAKTQRPGPMAMHTLYAVLAWYASVAGNHDQCMEHSASGLEHAAATGINIWTPQITTNALASAIAHDDQDTIVKLHQAAGDLPLEQQPIDVAYRACIFAWMHLRAGDYPAALRHQSVAQELARQIGMPFLIALAGLGMAQVLSSQQDIAGARRQLAAALRLARSTKLDVIVFPAQLLACRLLFNTHRDDAALAVLRRTLRSGRQQMHYNCYWWLGEQIADLCVRALNAGIETAYVQDLVRRRNLVPAVSPLTCAPWPWRSRVTTLGPVTLTVKGAVLQTSGKAQRKPLELLMILIAYGGREIPEARILDTLWPEAEPDNAYRSLITTVQRLRRLLDDPLTIRHSQGRLSLDDCRCWVDLWHCQQLLQKLDQALAEGTLTDVELLMQHVFSLYRGHFLQDFSAHGWNIATQENMHHQLINCIDRAGNLLAQANMHEHAARYYHQALLVDPLSEPMYRGLIQCYSRAGRPSEAHATYERCRRVLASTLGMPPSAQTESLYLQLRD